MAQSRVSELLERLQRHWADEGAPIGRGLLPGASEHDLDAAEHQLGFPLPLEVREWFGWRNGIDPESEDDPLFPTLMIPGNLSYSIKDRQQTLDHQIGETLDEDLVFQPAWLSITQPAKCMIVADCAVAVDDRSAAAPLHIVDFFDAEPWTTPRMPSITAMLEAWWQLTEDGIWRFDRESGEWAHSIRDVPPQWRDTGLFG